MKRLACAAFSDGVFMVETGDFKLDFCGVYEGSHRGQDLKHTPRSAIRGGEIEMSSVVIRHFAEYQFLSSVEKQKSYSAFRAIVGAQILEDRRRIMSEGQSISQGGASRVCWFVCWCCGISLGVLASSRGLYDQQQIIIS